MRRARERDWWWKGGLGRLSEDEERATALLLRLRVVVLKAKSSEARASGGFSW